MRRTGELAGAVSARTLLACALALALAAPPALAQSPGSSPNDWVDGGDADSGSGLRGTIAAASSPVLRDGDLDYPREPEAVQDGVMTAGTFEESAGAADPDLVNQRDPENTAAFEVPPAGHDPLLFQIEDVAPSNPDLNRLPRRLFELEPYDPVGIKVGSFVLFPEVEIGGVWTSNLFASPNAVSDGAIELLPSGRLVSNWAAHALEFSAGGDFSFYDDHPDENNRGYRVEARGRVDVTRRSNLQAVVNRERAKESRSAIDAATAGPPTYVTQDLAAATLSHRFNRLSLQLTGTITESRYDIADAGLSDRDGNEAALGVRASWEFKPTLVAFAAVEGNARAFDRASEVDGLSRDSDGRRYRAGVSFGDKGEILRGEVSLGYGVQEFDAPGVPDVDGAILDANLAWRLNALTALMLTASTDFTETTSQDAGGVIEHRLGLEARHAFRHSLVGSAGISGLRRSYAGIDVDESELALKLGLEYFLAREAVVFGRYEHIAFRSDFADGSYDADEVRVGLRLRR